MSIYISEAGYVHGVPKVQLPFVAPRDCDRFKIRFRANGFATVVIKIGAHVSRHYLKIVGGHYEVGMITGDNIS